MTSAQNVLRSLGINRTYKGYAHTVYAVELVLDNEERLNAVMKDIYLEAATHFDCKWTAIERNIRTVILRSWQVNRPLLIEMAGYPISSPPSASEFIEIISSHIMRLEEEEK